MGHQLTLLSLQPLLSRDSLQELVTFLLSSSLYTSIVVSKLLLSSLMELPHLNVVFLFLDDLSATVIDLCLLVGPLSTSLVELSLSVLLTLLKFTKTLRFLFFLFLYSDCFSNFGLFSLVLLTLVLSNLFIEGLLSRTSSLFLLKRSGIGNSDL